MNHSTLLPNAQSLVFDQFIVDDKRLILRVHSRQKAAFCPQCRQSSAQRHSFYWRKLTDLPFSGVAVHLHWRAQKFFCQNTLCSQKVFVERLPEVAALFARRTRRLDHVWNYLAFLVGGRAGARISERLALRTSRQTLLRCIRRTTQTDVQVPRVLGVDDFAFRRGQRYGTILIDLEKRRPVDLLPSRETGELLAWLKAHPGSEIITRDRSPVYAAAIAEGAPDAEQVADRFHLLKNIFEVFERILHRERKSIAAAAEEVRQSGILPTDYSGQPPIKQSVVPLTGKAAENRQRRIERYETVRRLRAEGCSINHISRKLRMHRETVRNFLAADTYPEPTPAYRRPSPAIKFDDYLQKRWRQGCANARQLFREIKQMGYGGCYASLMRYLRKWRFDLPPEERKLICRQVFRTPSPREIKWQICGSRPSLSENNQKFLDLLIEQKPEINQARDLVKEFQQILKSGALSQFDEWQKKVNQGDGIKELKTFAERLRRDHSAVRAAITSEWSNGQVEGQVCRLKLIKRQMYGRAGFDLLKARVLFQG